MNKKGFEVIKAGTDLTGVTIGHRTIIDRDMTKGRKHWNTECVCGKNQSVRDDAIRNGKSLSCGCKTQGKNGGRKAIDMKGRWYGDVEVLERSENIGSNGNIVWKYRCHACGKLGETAGDNLRLREQVSCGCKNSKGEYFIEKVFKKNNIKWISPDKIEQSTGMTYTDEKKFDALLGIGGRHLRFDVAVYIDGKLSHLIEFDGIQHYDDTVSWHTPELVEHDKRKNIYCKDNNIRLIRLRDYNNLTLADLV